MLAYVMREEQKEQEETAASQFQGLLFAHAFMPENTKLYRELYPEVGLTPEQEEGLGWEIPETEEDVARMMAELREVMPPA